MSKMVAYCGLVCSSCPTYLATLADDDEARAQTAAFYAEKFGLRLKPEDINCDGCLSEGGRLLGYCAACDIRRCAQEKRVINCAACPSAPCEALAKFHRYATEAKANFQQMRG